jgi:hypothetical protein
MFCPFVLLASEFRNVLILAVIRVSNERFSTTSVITAWRAVICYAADGATVEIILFAILIVGVLVRVRGITTTPPRLLLRKIGLLPPVFLSSIGFDENRLKCFAVGSH